MRRKEGLKLAKTLQEQQQAHFSGATKCHHILSGDTTPALTTNRDTDSKYVLSIDSRLRLHVAPMLLNHCYCSM